MPDRTPPSDEAGRILRFRQRRSSDLEAPDDDLAKYEKSREPDDYRHRMTMNIAGLIVVAVLVGAGLWLVNAIADLRKNQDCALTGRRNCAPIELNHVR
jgi:F0F1-type ATP synthase assembly protein I